ncbi:MAG: trypsin-like peptidase domain-containing protein, partial [Clostridia bacterium]|nr:trypsin-like peptidase domain-containing protein [Clostridia bacterium]
MDRKENIIIVKSDPDFEWERRSPRRRKNGKALLKKSLSCLLVAVLAFSGAVGGMFVYDEFIAEDTPAGGVVIQQQLPSPTPTGKPADPLAPDAPDQSADLPADALLQTGKATAAAVYETVSKSTVLFTCETVSQPSSGSLGDIFGDQFGGNFGVNPFQPQDPTQQDPSQQPSTAISYGSGVIMSADGYIMTNAHVVDGVTKINIRLFDGTVYEAKLVGSDPNTDVAVVKIDAQNLPA